MIGMGNSVYFTDPDILRIAEAHKVKPGQVALSWLVQRGNIVIPKSANPERMALNLQVCIRTHLSFYHAFVADIGLGRRHQLVHLSPEEMKVVGDIHKKPGMHRSLLGAIGGVAGEAFGWTYDQLGWPMLPDGSVTGGQQR